MTDTHSPLDEYREQLSERIAASAPELAEEVLATITREVPELVGPDPRLRDFMAQVLTAHLENLRAAIAYHVPADTAFVPLATTEHARLLAERDVPVDRILLGYQVAQRPIARALMEYLAALVEDRDELTQTINGALEYAFAGGDAAVQAATRAHAEAQNVWLRSRGAGLSQRVDAVLDGVVSDVAAAERMLGYTMSGTHVAAVVWLDEASAYPRDLLEAERQLQGLRGVQDALLVPRDERTLVCWLNSPLSVHVDEWMETARRSSPPARIAFGEPATGIDGFLLTYRQAQAAGGVLAAARPKTTRVVRYKDVAAVSFLVDQPVESKAWVEEMLGDLAGAGEGKERLRHTLRIFLDEGENAVAASRRLFVHRNTVKYRVDQARKLLPEPFESRRMDIALALHYCEWVPLWKEP